MTTTRTLRANLLQLGWKLPLLIALTSFTTSNHARIPNAKTDSQGSFRYACSGTLYGFQMTLEFDAKVTVRQGLRASLSSRLSIGSRYGAVVGTVFQSDWVVLYAFDSIRGCALHFYGPVRNHAAGSGGIGLSGSREEPVDGQRRVPIEAFAVYHHPFRWRF